MIRFFISSTFRDMQNERDAIHRTIYPIIRNYGLEKGVNIDICDLRWGIDFNENWTEEEAITEIMKVCFREVSECKPHIISMIGNYYGSKAKDSQSIVNLWSEYGRSVSDLPKDKEISLTQWELEFSFLSKRNIDTNAFCLFKTEIGEHQDREIVELKRRIKKKESKSKGKILCGDYSTIEDFEALFIDYAKSIIDKEAETETQKNWVTRELAYSAACCRELGTKFAARSEYVRKYRAFLSSNKNVIAFYGESGIGKSSLLSKLYLSTPDRYIKEFISCGSSQINSRYINVLLEIIYILESETPGIDCYVRDNIYVEAKAEEYLTHALETFENSTSDKSILIFVDAMDKLSVDDKNRIVQIFSEQSLSKVKLICSQIDSFSFEEKEKVTVFEIKALQESEIKEFLYIKLYDAKQAKKSLPKDNLVINEIANKKDACYPLYLNSVVNILRMHMAGSSSIESKNDYFMSLIKAMPDSTADIFWYSVEEALDFVFDKEADDKNKNNLRQAIGLVAISRHGLRELDLERIFSDCKWKNVFFSRLREYISDYFRLQENGCWVFSHDIIRRNVCDHFEQINGGELYRILYDFILSDKCKDVELKIREGIYLSYAFGNADLAASIFSLLQNDTSISIRTVTAKELETILQTEEGMLWYRMTINANPCAVMSMLDCILELKKDDDFSRRIPAKYAADLFWDIINIKDRHAIKKWCKQKNRKFEELYLMASFCTEYVAAYDSIGDYVHTIEYEYMPIDFFRSERNYKKFNEKQKIRAYRHMNTLFCINNSVLSNVHWLSKNVIEWHDKDALGLNNVETRMNGLYEGNRNQYYSAIGNYEISLRLRIASTIRQGAKLLAFLDVEDSTYFKKFLSMFGIERITSDIDKTVVPENIAIALHRSFWEEIIKIIEQVNNDPKYDDILESLFRLAMGYRVIAYEINKMSPDTTKNYRQLVSLGCESADISVFIFESDLIQQEKEQFSSEIRRIQIYSKLSDQNIDGLTNLANWCIKAINTYIDNSSSYGLGVGELLLESVEGAQERISKSSDTTLKKTIEKKIKELSSCLFEC